MTAIYQSPAPRLDPKLWPVSVAINLLSLGLPIFILLIYDRVLPNQATDTLIVLTGALIIIAVLDLVLRLGRAHVLNWSAMLFEHRLNCDALNHLLATDPSAYEQASPGTHLDRLQAVQALRAFYGSEARLQVMDLPFAALFFLLIWFIAGPLVLVPIVILGAVAVIGVTIGRELQRHLQARNGTDDKRQSFLLEVLGRVQSVKGRQMEPLMLRRYERLQENGSALTFEIVLASQTAQALGAVAANTTFLAVGLIGAGSVMAGTLTIGELAAATLLSGRAVQPMLGSLALWTRFQSLELAKDRLREVFETAVEATGDTTATLRERVSLKNVSFEPEKGSFGLHNINLDVKVGEIVGIRGNTASGKSLLLRVMAGELKPTTGQVLYDDVDIAHVPLAALRKLVSHVSPNPALFKGKLIENLCLFRGAGHVGRALSAAAAVGLDGVVSRLPRGYETMVGAGSEDELPLGIRQMIATTRALASNPRLLLLYQVDSSLDPPSDLALREALEGMRKNAAIVMVSHRPSTLAIADRIYEMEHGHLARAQKAPKRLTGAA